MARAADGMLVNISDTRNRPMFGSAGIADDSAQFPQLGVVMITAQVGRAVCGTNLSGSGAGEQSWLRSLAGRPDLVQARVSP
jgi:hypothetical protein